MTEREAPRIVRLSRSDMAEAARVHRERFDERLPWLAGLHTPRQDEAFFTQIVFETCAVYGSLDGPRLTGFIAFRTGWIDQFYVRPNHQGEGVGSRLLSLAQAAQIELQLWTFQRNEPAIRFYRRRGFAEIDRSDGSRNEEREPDVLLRWQRGGR